MTKLKISKKSRPLTWGVAIDASQSEKGMTVTRRLLTFGYRLHGLFGPRLILTCLAFSSIIFAKSDRRTSELIQSLLDQGVTPEQVVGIDDKGTPLVCGTGGVGGLRLLSTVQASGLPPGTRGWESIPGVIRNDGLETFRLEVDTNGPVARVMVNNLYALNLIPPQPPPFSLRDDGFGGDRIAGDFVFTSGPFRYNSSFPMPPFYRNDPASPIGLDVREIGALVIEELGGTTSQFLIGPKIGILSSSIPTVSTAALSPDIVLAPHLINIRTSNRDTQRFLRVLPNSLQSLTSQIYSHLPDAFDFLMLFSTNKVEQLPMLSGVNFISGFHNSCRVDYSGTGLSRFDFTSWWGSRGRLLGVNALDEYDRGIASSNATHEILHQWTAFLDFSLGLTDASGGHFNQRSSAASLVGGFLWTSNPDGSFTIDCNQGRNGATHASPLAKYMMGLIDGSAVPTLRAYSNNSSIVAKCSQPVLPGEITRSVTIADIQRFHDTRTPGPAFAKRDFALAFVAESHERLLNATEITFYETLAAHFTKTLPPNTPDPYLGFNWAPVTRFFKEGTTWRSDVARVAGDLDGDGKVDCADIAIVRESLGMRVLEPGFDSRADVNGDFIVDMKDLAFVTQKLPPGTHCP